MVASSQRVFKDAGCSPTIPEVPLEIPTAEKLLMTTAGRPYCKPSSLFRRIARLDANHLKGVVKNYVLTVQKPESRSHWLDPLN
jgi:hypothetical protein